MKKLNLLLITTLLGCAIWSCSDDKDDKTVVGLINATVTPQGSLTSYQMSVDQATYQVTNTDDPIAWDVTDAALENSVFKGTPTMGATIYINETPVTEAGATVDITAPVNIIVRDDKGHSATYTMTVTRATEAAEGESLILKSSNYNGLPSGLVYTDITTFNDRFYAFTVAVNGENEEYQLFNSPDGLNWTEITYQCADADNKPSVIGGEGAKLAVVNNRLILFGGARTKGTDKYGNPAEIENGWMGVAPKLDKFRVYSSSDGVNFTDDTESIVYNSVDGTPKSASQLAGNYFNIASLNGKLYIKDGYMCGFGMLQAKRAYVTTTDGKTWNDVNPEPADVKGSSINGAFFSFKNKLWVLGGYNSFISQSQAKNKIFSSADGTTWTEEGELPEELIGLTGAKVATNGDVAILIGGQSITDTNIMNTQLYRSEDGKTWSTVETSEKFSPRRSASVIVMGNTAWIFGGYKNATTSNYAYPDGNDGELLSDTWVKFIN